VNLTWIEFTMEKVFYLYILSQQRFILYKHILRVFYICFVYVYVIPKFFAHIYKNCRGSFSGREDLRTVYFVNKAIFQLIPIGKGRNLIF
jgi:hypothetical protein